LIQAEVKVSSNKEVFPGTFLISLIAPEICAVARPGQFLMVDCGSDFTLRRPISIHNCSGDDLQILFRVTGNGTAGLSQKKKGDMVGILGPQGNGFSPGAECRSVSLIAGGMGIAPLLFLANRCLSLKKDVTLLMGAASASQLYPAKSLPGGIKTAVATDDGSSGHKGMVTDLAKEYIAAADQAFACGPVPMYISLAKMSASKKMKTPLQVSVETRMGCGFGLCYGCTIKTLSGIKQACTDGPVFNLNEIDWEWLKIR
jgi:dihydroorotate dehydrogenase electron transfer subunit